MITLGCGGTDKSDLRRWRNPRGVGQPCVFARRSICAASAGEYKPALVRCVWHGQHWQAAQGCGGQLLHMLVEFVCWRKAGMGRLENIDPKLYQILSAFVGTAKRECGGNEGRS